MYLNHIDVWPIAKYLQGRIEKIVTLWLAVKHYNKRNRLESAYKSHIWTKKIGS